MGPYAIKEEDYKLLDLPSSPFGLEDIPVEERKTIFDLYSAYMYFFTQFLIKNTNLGKIDAELGKSSDIIVPVKEKEKDTYQKLAGDMLQYFYIRNNLYLHRLSDKEYAILAYKVFNGDLTYDRRMEKLIAKTYKKIMFEQVPEAGSLVNYGPDDEMHVAPNNSLILGFRCADTPDEATINKQNAILADAQERLEADMVKRLKWPVNTLRYESSSVRTIDGEERGI